MTWNQPTVPAAEPGAPAPHGVRRWFAIQARPRAEQVAAHTLATLDLEVFLPRIRQLRSSPTAAESHRPLFPGYLFARLCLPHHLHAVRYSRGVLRVLGGREHPVPVDDAVIDACRSRQGADGFVVLEDPGFKPGDRLRIEFGPFAGFEGVFIRTLDESSRVLILLEAMQQAQLILERRHLVPAGS
ncbi:MAG: transcription termination/antitermination protein NusG [Verrucomicrobiota bacterium]